MNKFAGRIAAGVLALALAGAAHAQVVVSQVYGGGGNSGAPLRSDFIELHNNSASAVDLSGWSVQYASATGTSWQRTELGGSIAAGAYYLIQQASGANADAPALPTPAVIGTIAMASGAGKVALVNTTTVLSGACPTGNVDFVGYGTTANCAEGAAPTANLSNTTAALRADNGCTDTASNGADFSVGAPAPRNGASAPFACSGANLPVLSINDVGADERAGSLLFELQLSQPAGPGGVTVDYATADGTANAGADYVGRSGSITLPEGVAGIGLSIDVIDDALSELDETFLVNLSNARGANLDDAQATGTIVDDDFVLIPIHQIQGSGTASPLVGQRVHTSGIVTGRKSNGYFIQTPDAEADPDPATSQGLFVFTSAAPPAIAAAGNLVQVAGTVTEFVPAQDPGQAPLTELGFASTTLLSTGHALPAPVTLTPTLPDPAGPLEQLERVEGMRVTAPSFTVAAPTEGDTSEPNASGSSNGILHAVVTGVARPLREPGIQAPDPAPAGGSIPPIPRWDFNPELLTVDSDGFGGAAFTLDLEAGAVITNLTGPLDFGFRRYTILRDPAVAIGVTPGAAPRAARVPTGDEFTVAAYNLERFFDTVNDAGTDDPVLTAAAYEKRLNKASLGIRNFLNTPDILGVVEMEKLPVLQTLAARLNADALADGQPDPQYVAYLDEGNDIGGIDVGFLVKTAGVATGIARVEVVSVTQVGKDTTWIEPDGSSSLLNDRPPLVLDAVVHYADGRAFPVTVIVVHNRSLNDVDDAAAGDRVRRKRQRQAEFLATLIDERQTAAPDARIVTLGDFNAFAFNDGYVDAMNVIAGTPTPDEQTAVPGDGVDLIDPDLINLGELAPAAERYSFVFDGTPQALDHVLVNEELVVMTRSAEIDHARINADFPEVNRNDADSPSRLSDHDPVVAYFVPRRHADLGVTAAATATTVRIDGTIGFNATLTNHGPEAADTPGLGFALDGELPTMAVVAPAGWSCDAPQVDAGKTSVACNAAALASGETLSFAVTATATQALIGTTVNLAVASDAQSFDPVPGNNQASTGVEVFAIADLGVGLHGPGKQLRSGSVGRYLVTLRNAGADVAPQTRLTITGDAPPANVAVVAPRGWACAVAGTGAGFAVNCSAETLAAHATRLFKLSILAPPRVGDERLIVVATVESLAQDPKPRNNTATHAVRLIGSPR